MLTLTPDQLRELTRHKRSDAQARELEHLGVPFRTRRDGSLVVLLADLAPADRGRIVAPEREPEPEMMP